MDIEKYIPRSKEYFWVKTKQEAWSVSKYRARYRIYFDNVNIDMTHIINTNPGN